MQERMYTGKDGFRTGGMQVKDGCRTRGLQDRRDAGKEGCKKRGMKGRRDEGKRDEGKERRRKGGIQE